MSAKAKPSVATSPSTYRLFGRQILAHSPAGYAKRGQVAFGLALVMLVTTAAVALAMQGWRARVPAFDMIPHIYNAHNLVTNGVLPQRGDTSSYGSYSPPGPAWLMAPGALLFADPRLFEYIGAALLHFATLLGLFLLARRYFGTWCACLVVVLYGLSDIGLFLAGSLWPIGSPDSYIWMIYLASLWVSRKDARFLAAALTVWACGMYLDMAVFPALLIIPALWVVYRPPVRLVPLFVGGALILTLWFPYLQFEVPREFVDIRSQLLLQNIFPTEYRQAWCDPNLKLISPDNSSAIPDEATSLATNWGGPLPYSVHMLLVLAGEIGAKLLYNFDTTIPVPGVSIAMLILALASMALLSTTGRRYASELQPKPFSWDLFSTLGIAMVLVGGLAYAAMLAYDFGSGGASMTPSVLLKLPKVLAIGGLLLLAARWSIVWLDRMLVQAGVTVQSVERAQEVRLLLICLLIPWSILLLVAEPGKPERFWWLWPMQLLFVSALITYVLPRLSGSRRIQWAVQCVIIGVVLANTTLLSHAGTWLRLGWAGVDAPEIEAVDYIANQLHAEKRQQAAIGYNILIYDFMATYNITNPQYKIGAELDLLLDLRQGIANLDSCAEGIAQGDEYRIARTTPMREDWAPRAYFDAPIDARFHLLQEFGPYRIYRRST